MVVTSHSTHSIGERNPIVMPSEPDFVAAGRHFPLPSSTDTSVRAVILQGALLEGTAKDNKNAETQPQSVSKGLAHTSGAYFAEGSTAPVRSRLRVARLFEAGDYPDKQVTITPGDLDRIAMAFTRAGEPCPVKIEHMDTPLDPVGHLVAVYRKANTLCGILAFTDKAHDYLEECGVQHLSVQLVPVTENHSEHEEAVHSDTPYLLTEVSLVLHPRVASAGFMPPGGDPLTFSSPGTPLFPRHRDESDNHLPRSFVSENKAENRLSQWRAEGRITPAMEPFLAVLFSGENPTQINALTNLLGTLPITQPRGARVPVSFAQDKRKQGNDNRQGSDPDTDYPPDAVVDMAKKLGLDPVRMWKNVKLLRQVNNPM